MLCLGPIESDWNQRKFQVTSAGCLGGRKMPENLEKEFILFKDTTVSRRHFEISYDTNRNVYALRDLGSAGGSFIRISHGVRKVLHPGMILLMGKHQFTVSSVDTHAPKNTSKADATIRMDSEAEEKVIFEPKRVPADAGNEELSEIMDDAEAFLNMLEEHASNSASAAINSHKATQGPVNRSQQIKNKLSSLKAGLLKHKSAEDKEELTLVAEAKGGSNSQSDTHSFGTMCPICFVCKKCYISPARCRIKRIKWTWFNLNLFCPRCLPDARF